MAIATLKNLMNDKEVKSEFNPTPAQKRALVKARKNRGKGQVLTLNELKTSLGITD